MSKETKYLTMFDCEGFECLIDITSRERHLLLSELKGESYSDDLNLSAIMLRARANAHRNPEIWVFTSTVDDATLQRLRKKEPQMLADLIRKHGTSVWKNTPTKQVIQ